MSSEYFVQHQNIKVALSARSAHANILRVQPMQLWNQHRHQSEGNNFVSTAEWSLSQNDDAP